MGLRSDVTEGVIRIGDTGRRPHQPQSWAVAGYLDHLAAVDFSIDGTAASPRFLVSIPGDGTCSASFPATAPGARLEPWSLTDALLASVGHLALTVAADTLAGPR